MWVLPKKWYPPKWMGWESRQGSFLCMIEGYDRKLVWLTEEEIVLHWSPYHFKKDPTPLPSWIRHGNTVLWIVNDKRDIKADIAILNTRVGWGIVVSLTNLKDYSDEEYRQSLSFRHGGFFWFEQRYTCFFCKSKDLVEGLKPLTPITPSIYDRVRDRSSWVQPTDFNLAEV